MTIAITSPITGSAQTGFTSPTYTHVADTPPDVRSKQVAVTALGGTQSGVLAHSPNCPFTITVKRPGLLKTLSAAVLNGITGIYSRVPSNVYSVITRKGAAYSSNQYGLVLIRTEISVPAGADTFDAANVRAGLSAHIGSLSQQAAGIGDTATSGIL